MLHQLVEGRAALQAASGTAAGAGDGVGEADPVLADHFVHLLDAQADTQDLFVQVGVERLDQTSHKVADVGVLAQGRHLAVDKHDRTLDGIDVTFGQAAQCVVDQVINLFLDTGEVVRGVGQDGKRGHVCKGL